MEASPADGTQARLGMSVSRMTRIHSDDMSEDRPERAPEPAFTEVREKDPVTG
jgi:hypothetical protein